MNIFRTAYCAAIVMLFVFTSHGPLESGMRVISDKDSHPVKALLFYSKDCKSCMNVKPLIKYVNSWPKVKFKFLDIDKVDNYRLFSRMEDIHGDRAFTTPLIMVGDSILIGERDIKDNLEKIVMRLSKNGGAALPYLGDQEHWPKRVASQSGTPKEKEDDCGCDQGGPPSVQEEIARVKGLLDWLF